jgi:hypothetical protein
MKTSIKFATGLILAAAALVASGSAALAGEGGSAGSVSIKFGTPTVIPAVGTTPAVTIPNVARLSTSVAVGKGFAVATARTGATDAFTSAVGAGGGFDLTDANGTNAAFSNVTETAGDLEINQENSFVGSGVTTLAPATGVTLAD